MSAYISNYENHYTKLPPCYIYLYHTDEWFQLPQYPESLQDNLESSFNEQSALGRTAPIYSYNRSGPRTMQITLKLHRDMMNSINTEGSNVHYKDGSGSIITAPGDDYVDILIKKLQAIALPKYNTASKMITPPMIALRFGEDVFIKGVVASGGVTVTYDLPILENNKYAQVGISFTVSEVGAYDAESVSVLGSFRGLTSGLREAMGYSTQKNSSASTAGQAFNK